MFEFELRIVIEPRLSLHFVLFVWHRFTHSLGIALLRSCIANCNSYQTLFPQIKFLTPFWQEFQIELSK